MRHILLVLVLMFAVSLANAKETRRAGSGINQLTSSVNHTVTEEPILRSFIEIFNYYSNSSSLFVGSFSMLQNNAVKATFRKMALFRLEKMGCYTVVSWRRPALFKRWNPLEGFPIRCKLPHSWGACCDQWESRPNTRQYLRLEINVRVWHRRYQQEYAPIQHH